MIHFSIQSEHILGYVTKTTAPGEIAKVCCKDVLTSDQPYFYKLIEQTSKLYLSKTSFPIDSISKYLIVLHKDNKADIYINDFPEKRKVRINRPINQGEKVFHSDISDIVEVDFPDIPILPDDAIEYCVKSGWKFGMYFDYTRKLDLDKLKIEIGKLIKDLFFENTMISVNYELSQIPNNIAFLITEGKTDWKHLQRAAKELSINLPIGFNAYNDTMGDTELEKMCKYYSMVPQPRKMIFIFDQDNREIIKLLNSKTQSGKSFQNWGNNVYSFYLPKPPHRGKYNSISIELFYTDDELHSKDPVAGTRLLFTNEVDRIVSQTSKKSVVVKRTVPNADDEFNKRIYDDDVKTIVNSDGGQIAHSKAFFADKVYNKAAGYERLDFLNFQLVFDRIQEILRDEL